MSLKKYPFERDFVSILGYNKNGWLQVRAMDRIFRLVADVRFYMTQIIAQFIHDELIQEFPDATHRQDTEWYQAVGLLLCEYGTDFTSFINATVECLLVKACYVIMQKNQDFPSSGTTLIAVEDEKYEVKKSFIYFLHDLGGSHLGGPHFEQLIRLATDQEAVKITFEDVKICLGEELLEIFERRKDEILSSSFNYPGGNKHDTV